MIVKLIQNPIVRGSLIFTLITLNIAKVIDVDEIPRPDFQRSNVSAILQTNHFLSTTVLDEKHHSQLINLLNDADVNADAILTEQELILGLGICSSTLNSEHLSLVDQYVMPNYWFSGMYFLHDDLAKVSTLNADFYEGIAISEFSNRMIGLFNNLDWDDDGRVEVATLIDAMTNDSLQPES